MAGIAARTGVVEVTTTDIQRWRRLFGYAEVQAAKHIEEYRADLSRTGITDVLWSEISGEKEAAGWDRESYEYSLSHKPVSLIKSKLMKGTFLVKVEDPLNLSNFLSASALSEMPQMSHGSCEDGTQDDAWFATVDGAAKQSILEWLSQHAPWYTPTFVRITKAAKTLNVHNSGPKLGFESTLPQYMPNDTGASALRPQQNVFPVWYFFYGTLANPSILSRALERPEEADLPVLYPASVNGGVVRTWAGKYRALVDSPSGHKSSIVMEYAYLVQSKEEEDHLRIYETDKYDVVRCDIDFGCTHRIEKGLTFRFAGKEDELDKQAKGYRSLSMDVGRHFEDVSDILKAVSANL